MTLTLTRTLQIETPMQHGPDVAAAQHLLTAKGFPCAADGVFGPETGGACVEAKKRLRYVQATQTPTCGQALVDALEAHTPFPPLPPPPPNPEVTAYVDWWRWGIAHNSQIGYSQGGHRLDGEKLPAGTLPLFTDCSGLTYVFADWAKLKLPYTGAGNTNSLVNQCSTITEAQAAPGDLIEYGVISGGHILDTHHVVTILALLPGGDFDCGSHGSAAYPCRLVKHSAEAAWQAQHGYPAVFYRRIPR